MGSTSLSRTVLEALTNAAILGLYVLLIGALFYLRAKTALSRCWATETNTALGWLVCFFLGGGGVWNVWLYSFYMYTSCIPLWKGRWRDSHVLLYHGPLQIATLRCNICHKIPVNLLEIFAPKEGPQYCFKETIWTWVVVSDIFFSPGKMGKWSNLTKIFWNGY